jgi:hypothetical protein
MNNQFDELTKSLAQSVTRRAALKKFGVGLAGMALACFGLANKAQAGLTNYAKCVRKCHHQHPTWTDYQCQTACFSAGLFENSGDSDECK